MDTRFSRCAADHALQVRSGTRPRFDWDVHFCHLLKPAISCWMANTIFLSAVVTSSPELRAAIFLPIVFAPFPSWLSSWPPGRKRARSAGSEGVAQQQGKESDEDGAQQALRGYNVPNTAVAEKQTFAFNLWWRQWPAGIRIAAVQWGLEVRRLRRQPDLLTCVRFEIRELVKLAQAYVEEHVSLRLHSDCVHFLENYKSRLGDWCAILQLQERDGPKSNPQLPMVAEAPGSVGAAGDLVPGTVEPWVPRWASSVATAIFLSQVQMLMCCDDDHNTTAMELREHCLRFRGFAKSRVSSLQRELLNVAFSAAWRVGGRSKSPTPPSPPNLTTCSAQRPLGKPAGQQSRPSATAAPSAASASACFPAGPAASKLLSRRPTFGDRSRMLSPPPPRTPLRNGM